jgi:hypothetical protein
MKFDWVKRLLLGLVGAVLVVMAYQRLRLARIPEMVCVDTPKWQGTGQLRVRMESVESDAILVQLVRDYDDHPSLVPSPDQDFSAIYRHRPGHQELDALDSRMWAQGQGDIGDCLGRTMTKTTRWSDGYQKDFLLRFDGRVIPTAGKGVVLAALSPNDELASVVSSEIPQTPGMILARAPSGQFFHQFFRVRDGVQVGDTLRVPKLSRAPQQVLQSCWTPDSRYVVYADDLHGRLCVEAAP